MRGRTLAIATAILAACGAAPILLAQVNVFPQTMPANTVYGRTAIGSGPGQAIPMGTLFGLLFNSSSAPTAHAVLLGEGSSSLGTAPVGTAGRALLDQGAGADPAFTAMSGDAIQASSGAVTIAANAVTNAKSAQAANLTFKCNVSGGTGNVSDCTGGNFALIACPPNVSIKITGTAATYTLPTCNSAQPAYLEIDVVGGGGGPPGSGTTPGAGTAGNDSTFVYNSVTYTGGGGGTATAGINQAGGVGGTASGCDENITGGQGEPSVPNSTAARGVTGGGTTLSPGAPGGTSAGAPNGVAGNTNTGAGGGGGAQGSTVAPAPAGGGGATCKKLIVAVAGQTTATYTVGGTATGGTMGTSGGAGGTGAAGRIRIIARWQ